MNRKHRILIWSLFGLYVLLSTSTADAIPAFARRYGLTCRTCHAGSHPVLNPFGRAVKENGYQLPIGATSPITYLKTRQIAENLTLLERVPLTIRTRSIARFEQEDADDPNIAAPAQFDLLSGGPLSKDVSYFLSFGLFGNDTVQAPTLAFVQFHNIGEEGLANLQIGKFNILDYQFPNHRLFTMSVSPVGTVSVGRNPFILDTHHVGVDLYGRPRSGPIFYEVALVNGTAPTEAEGADGGNDLHGGHGTHGAVARTDSDSFKDVFARLTYTLPNKRHTIGVLGYFGKTALPMEMVTDQLHDAAAGEHEADQQDEHSEMSEMQEHGEADEQGEAEHGEAEHTEAEQHEPEQHHEESPALLQEEDNDTNGDHAGQDMHDTDDVFRIFGVDAELNLWRFHVRGAFLLGHHDNPHGNDVSVDYQGVMGYISYPIQRNLLASVRYDGY